MINNIFKIIEDLYKNDNIYTIDNIIDSINENINIHINLIYLAMDYIIDKKITLYGMNGMKGYLIYKKNYYIFQPELYNDEYLPIYYRYNLLNNNITHLSVDSLIREEGDEIISELDITYDGLLDKINKEKDKIINNDILIKYNLNILSDIKWMIKKLLDMVYLMKRG